MKEKKPVPVTIHLPADAGARKTDNLFVYVVNDQGKIIETSKFTGTKATITQSLGQSRVYIAPAIPKVLDSKANERLLLKAGAYEVVKNFSANNQIMISQLPSIVLQPWLPGNCLITGHVNKNFLIDGEWKNLPVCNARVHICEVETELEFPYIPIYRRRIPDWVINALSQEFAKVGDKIKQMALNPIPKPDPIGPVIHEMTNISMRTQKMSAPLQEIQHLQSLPTMPDQVMSAVTSGSVSVVKKALYDYHELLYPWLCLWPVYWPWIYEWDEETIVKTDSQGHFEMWENTFTEDGPLNIYVWVEIPVEGSAPITVYKPPLPCNTYWNYACGTDINITVTDDRVKPCPGNVDVPDGAIVWFRSIGEYATATHIEQADPSNFLVQGAAKLKNTGCTDVTDPYEKIHPFGGTLNFKLLFGKGLPYTTPNPKVTHYRWKKTMIKDANMNDIPSPITSVMLGEVRKYYFVIVGSGPFIHFETHSILLGAEGIGNNAAYRIPHWDITQEPLIPAIDVPLDKQWTSPDFWSASIDSHSLDDGLWRFDLELGYMDSSSAFHAVSMPKWAFQVSEEFNSGNSQAAPEPYLIDDSGNASNAVALTCKVRIDNTPCSAVIQETYLTDGLGHLVLDGYGQPVKSGTCGFIHYRTLSDGARISFIASHPHNFARFWFNVVKGNGTENPGASQAGFVISSVGSYTLSGGVFTNDFPVSQLLGSCPQAAYAENLYVRSLATNGTDWLYDASDTKAFALSNT